MTSNKFKVGSTYFYKDDPVKVGRVVCAAIFTIFDVQEYSCLVEDIIELGELRTFNHTDFMEESLVGKDSVEIDPNLIPLIKILYGVNTKNW